MKLNEFIDTMGNSSQTGFWEVKEQKELKTGVTVAVCWNRYDGSVAAVESKGDFVISHYIRTDEIVTPDYVVIKNYVWTDENAPWIYLSA